MQSQCPEFRGAAGCRGSRPHVWLVLLGLLAAHACGGDQGPPGSEADAGPGITLFTLETPSIEAVSPGQVSLGDRIQVFGHDFIAPENGSMHLVLTGTFQAGGREEIPVQEEHALEVQNPSLASFTFDSLFEPGKLGTFYGSATVVSRADVEADNAAAGSERSSKQTAVTLEVKPSIEVTSLRSVESDHCPAVTEATNGGSELSFGVRVVGLGDGTVDEPLVVRVGFISPALAVTYVKNDVYTSWPLDWHPGLDDAVYTDAPPGRNTMTFELESGDTLTLDPHAAPVKTRISPSVQIRNQPQTEVLLGRMLAGQVEEAGALTVAFFVEAERAGRTAQRSVELQVYNEFEVMPFDGTQRMVERYPAEVPPGYCGSCIPGGDIGRDVTYTEGESASRTKSVSMRWDVNTANSVGLTAGHMVYAQAQLNSSWSSTFGTDVSEAVTTENHRTLNITAHVLPTFYGICYRQVSRYEKSVDILYHGECGASAVVGQAVMTDWGWGYDVATGQACPPTTNLPGPLRADP